MKIKFRQAPCKPTQRASFGDDFVSYSWIESLFNLQRVVARVEDLCLHLWQFHGCETDLIGRGLTATNLQYTPQISNFKDLWKAIVDRKESDKPETPKITKALPIMKWTEKVLLTT